MNKTILQGYLMKKANVRGELGIPAAKAQEWWDRFQQDIEKKGIKETKKTTKKSPKGVIPISRPPVKVPIKKNKEYDWSKYKTYPNIWGPNRKYYDWKKH